MPDDGSAPAVKAFIDALWDGWIKAGPISYTEFEKLSKKVLGSADVLPRSTVQANLKHRDRRRSPPRWEWVLRFWKVLLALAEEHDIDPDSLGTLEGLKRLHEAALAEATLAGQRVGAPSIGTAVGSLPNLGPGSGPEVPALLWEQCAEAFPDADVRHDEMLASIRRRVGVEWWHDYRDVVPAWFESYLSLEPAASLIHVYDNAVVPSLLQTEAYARAALRLEPLALPEAAIARMIELRMRRQQIIRRDNRDNDAPRLWAVLDEGAVRRQFGDANVMRGQLVHLIDICDHPNITIQVIPASPGIRTTLSYPLTLLRFRIHEVPDVAYFEPITTGFYNHEAAHVSRYAQVLEALAAEALPPPETVAYLRRLHEEL
jgi:Domain of unknown function (DUF5753)